MVQVLIIWQGTRTHDLYLTMRSSLQAAPIIFIVLVLASFLAYLSRFIGHSMLQSHGQYCHVYKNWTFPVPCLWVPNVAPCSPPESVQFWQYLMRSECFIAVHIWRCGIDVGCWWTRQTHGIGKWSNLRQFNEPYNYTSIKTVSLDQTQLTSRVP